MRSKTELISAVEQGAAFTYLPFYGHAPEPDGAVGPGCLSQHRWRGLNLLGFALGEVRALLAGDRRDEGS